MSKQNDYCTLRNYTFVMKYHSSIILMKPNASFQNYVEIYTHKTNRPRSIINVESEYIASMSIVGFRDMATIFSGMKYIQILRNAARH